MDWVSSSYYGPPCTKTTKTTEKLTRGVSLEGTGRLRGGSGGWPGVLLNFVADSGGCSGDSHPALVKKEFAFQSPLHAHTSLALISTLRLLYTSTPTRPPAGAHPSSQRCLFDIPFQSPSCVSDFQWLSLFFRGNSLFPILFAVFGCRSSWHFMSLA